MEITIFNEEVMSEQIFYVNPVNIIIYTYLYIHHFVKIPMYTCLFGEKTAKLVYAECLQKRCILHKVNHKVRCQICTHTLSIHTMMRRRGKHTRPWNASSTVHGADLPVPGQGAGLVRPEAAHGGRRAG
jgi:hypothetical protein